MLMPTVGELWSSDTTTVRPLSSFFTATGSFQVSVSAAWAANARHSPATSTDSREARIYLSLSTRTESRSSCDRPGATSDEWGITVRREFPRRDRRTAGSRHVGEPRRVAELRLRE